MLLPEDRSGTIYRDIEDFRAIIIGESLCSDTFTEIYTFLAQNVLIYLLKKDYPFERSRSSDYVFTLNEANTKCQI